MLGASLGALFTHRGGDGLGEIHPGGRWQGLLQGGEVTRQGHFFCLLSLLYLTSRPLPLFGKFSLGTTLLGLSVFHGFPYPSKFNRSSLLAVVMFLNIAMDIDPLHLGKYKFRFLWDSVHSIFINWPIHNLVLCVFLFKDIYLVYWFILYICMGFHILIYIIHNILTNIEFMADVAQELMSEWSLSNTSVPSVRHVTLLHSGSLDSSTSAPRLGAI